MTPAERRHIWETLLKEPVAASARVRSIRQSIAGPLKRGSAILTESRFLIIRRRLTGPFPKNSDTLSDAIYLQIPRNDITGVSTISEKKTQDLDLRWFDGEEQKIHLCLDRETASFRALMEQDLSRASTAIK